MSKSVFAGNSNSQYDAGLIAKEVHDYFGQAIRITDATSQISGYFTHFSATYNSDNNPTNVVYYRGETPTKTNVTFTADVAGSLNNTYFTIYSAPDNKRYHVWYNVSNLGTDPAPSNSTGIEVQIDINESALVVCFATSLTITNTLNNIFTITRNYDTIEIKTYGLGLTSESVDFNTGFNLTCTVGTQAEVSNIKIEYSGKDPYFNNTVLRGYVYDIYSGKFSKSDSNLAEIVARSINLSNYIFQDFNDTGTGILYIGTVTSTGAYIIQQVTQTGANVEIRYANSSNNSETTYEEAWTNQDTLAYTYIDQLTEL